MGYKIVKSWKQRNGETVSLTENKSDKLPYGVQYRGQGHYFGTISDAMKYCLDRGFRVNL